MINRIQTIKVVVLNAVLFRALLLKIPPHGMSSGQITSDWTTPIIEVDMQPGLVPLAKYGV